MTTNWAATPKATCFGDFSTAAKSSVVSVMPIPNMINPNPILMSGTPNRV